jgi:hypothetical protein
MASEKIDTIDYSSIISDLEAKKAALEASIASLRAAQSHGALGRAVEGNAGPVVFNGASSFGENGKSSDLPQGALHGKTIPQAIKIYLSAVKKRQTNRQITDALQDHGMASTGSLEISVTGALNRMKGQELLRFKDGWALADWHPDSFKSRFTDSDAKKGNGKRGKRKKSKRQMAAPQTPTAKLPEDELSPQERILALLRSKPDSEFPGHEIIGKLGIKQSVGNLVLGRIVFRKLAERLPNGNYLIRSSHASATAVQ